jgi:hypothetical protein
MDEDTREGSPKRTRMAYWVGASLAALVAIIGIQYLVKLTVDATPSVWLAMMRRQMPDAMCKSGGFFRTCFQASEEECRAAVDAQFDACAAKPGAVPAVVNGETGRAAGKILGECIGVAAGDRFDKTGKLIADPKCLDPAQWKW